MSACLEGRALFFVLNGEKKDVTILSTIHEDTGKDRNGDKIEKPEAAYNISLLRADGWGRFR